ncbi:MAG: hypothetical protein ACKVZJ_07360 [Phycisphaerales bacterium]
MNSTFPFAPTFNNGYTPGFNPGYAPFFNGYPTNGYPTANIPSIGSYPTGSYPTGSFPTGSYPTIPGFPFQGPSNFWNNSFANAFGTTPNASNWNNPWNTFGTTPGANWNGTANWSNPSNWFNSFFPGYQNSFPTNNFSNWYASPFNQGFNTGWNNGFANSFPGTQNFQGYPGIQAWNPWTATAAFPGFVPGFPGAFYGTPAFGTAPIAQGFPFAGQNVPFAGPFAGQNIPFGGIPASYPFNGAYGTNPGVRNNGSPNPGVNPQAIREAA